MTGTPTTRWTIINASAGSGKTYRLTELLTERLSRGVDDAAPLKPSQIIATTFTRAAAAELTQRIRAGLIDQGHLEQAAALPTALIGTVNSVTGRILTDFAVDAGRTPDLQVLTEDTAQKVFTLSTDQIIADAEESHRNLLTRTGYNRGDEKYGSKAKVNWGDTIRRITDYARANNIAPADLADCAEDSISTLTDVLDAEAGDTPPTDTRRILADAAVTNPDVLRAEITDGKPKALNNRIDALHRFARTVKEDFNSLPWFVWMQAAEAKIPGAGTGEPIKRIRETYGGLVNSSQFLADPALRQDLAELTRLVFATAAESLRNYQEYKDALGLIDFTDQEQLTLRLLRGDGVDPDTAQAVRETIADRYRVLVVDEFQDTSPLQLALFTELADLVEEVIWVGDPKQSIYAFRGADPSLMDEAVDALTDPDGLAGTAETLRYSYRTRQAPLDLSNRLFSRLFPDTTVTLSVPDNRALAYAQDGVLAPGETVTWGPHPEAKVSNSEWFSRIADGLSSLGTEPVADGEVPRRAVLTRSKAHAADVRAALHDRGIACVGSGVPLSDTREGQLVAAALSYLIDGEATQSLIELITLLPDHPAHGTWFDDLTGAIDREARSELFDVWGRADVLAPITRLRGKLTTVSVRELVVVIMDALDLRGRTAASQDPTTRTGAVLGILRAVEDYTADRESEGAPATPAGFLDYLSDEETGTAPVNDPGAVEVTTVHSAKGLEWDTVVVAMADKQSEGKEMFSPAGVWVQATRALTMSDPLAGRSIRFWPETLLAHPGVKQALAETPVQVARRQAEVHEERRLLYVAMTRAKFRTVLAPKTSIRMWKAFRTLDSAKNVPVEVLAPFAIQDDELDALTVDSEPLPAVYLPEPEESPVPSRMLDVDRDVTPVDREVIPATFPASSVDATPELDAAATVTVIADLGAPLVTGGAEGWNKVGDCIHSYLAAPLQTLDASMKNQVATRLVTNWGVSDKVTAAQVVESGERWIRWLDSQFPDAATATEVPFTWTNDAHQRAQGWIDQLITVPGDSGDRQIIVDHKTYPGTDPVGHVTKNYLGQMDVYRQAMTDISGVSPAQILIHLPLLGSVVEVVLP
ncbi:UvrD-helicase domain-containing protein [Corynebacterium terpenotabidum]|uniref:DNA 3'-5' helicase n=1 Tax=Corynebacterium terpenotabidum Y-11 TaxID=1200352 RepID=S4XCS7_9CORY|nr:UvrD-helicase domain-containing protein [Corynebacterium terpenotabidum]AGP30391.1 ATP-dependent DNA helicase II [Corynebacterium terpenotabidum Y-11]